MWTLISIFVILVCIGGGLFMFVSSIPAPAPAPEPEITPTPDDPEVLEKARALAKAQKLGVKVL
jgi:hypothetical protein